MLCKQQLRGRVNAKANAVASSPGEKLAAARGKVANNNDTRQMIDDAKNSYVDISRQPA